MQCLYLTRASVRLPRCACLVFRIIQQRGFSAVVYGFACCSVRFPTLGVCARDQRRRTALTARKTRDGCKCPQRAYECLQSTRVCDLLFPNRFGGFIVHPRAPLARGCLVCYSFQMFASFVDASFVYALCVYALCVSASFVYASPCLTNGEVFRL